MAKSNNQKQSNGSNLDFEAQLWAAADKMRGHMDASEYKTLRSANTNCSNRRVNRDFSLSTSNGERVGVRCRIPRNADSFRADLHPDLKADFVPVRKDLANPPFNMSDWRGENLRQDVRWKFGIPPVNNANYA
jgi:type I restriction-modification system DNA methylase subunit